MNYYNSNSFNKMSLLEASTKGNLDRVRYLLSVGIDPNFANNRRQTPLLGASYNGHLEVVKELLSARAAEQILILLMRMMKHLCIGLLLMDI